MLRRRSDDVDAIAFPPLAWSDAQLKGRVMSEQLTVVRATEGVGLVGTAGVNTTQSVTVVAMPWWQMLMIRVLRVYLMTLAGLLPADGLGMIELSKAGSAWQHIGMAAYVATAPAFASLLWNAIEFLTNLDVSRPGWRA